MRLSSEREFPEPFLGSYRGYTSHTQTRSDFSPDIDPELSLPAYHSSMSSARQCMQER